MPPTTPSLPAVPAVPAAPALPTVPDVPDALKPVTDNVQLPQLNLPAPLPPVGLP